jgi:glyoxylase-like metal-dependent hydrolase (beta-lactamase superfamily II)
VTWVQVSAVFVSGVVFGNSVALVRLWWPMGDRELLDQYLSAARRLDRRWAREQLRKGPGG